MQRSLDGFTLIELIGFGRTGEVWRARPDGGGTDVALKWLTDETVDTARLGAAELRHFNHPHVARLLDLRRDLSQVVLVCEFIAGVSLASLLAERDRLSSAEVVTLLTPIADVLAAAHDAGLLHGNLTPTDILVTPEGRPILTDLGVWQSLGKPPSVGGRLDYLDPSVARGGPLTNASDVFGAAAIGFHALTGRPPWMAGSGADAWALAADGAGVDLAPLRASASSGLADVIARGLSDQPRHRGSARAFAADVREAVEPQPLHLSGPYVWPDLPALSEGVDGPSGSDAAGVGWLRGSPQSAPGTSTGPVDIAGEVRRGSSARHAAPPGSRRERDSHRRGIVDTLGHDPPSALRRAARAVPRRTVTLAFAGLALLMVVVLGLGWNTSKAVPAQAGGPVGDVSTEIGRDGPDDESDAADDGLGTDDSDIDDSGTDDSGTDDSDIDEQATPGSAQGWLALVSLLYERRALAFGTGATAVLEQVFSPDSAQLIVDTTELRRLVQAGQVLRGFTPRVLEVLEVSVEGDRAQLQITDEFANYETVPAADTRAAALASNPGRGPAQVAMTLIRTPDGWRIQVAQRAA